MKKIVKLILFIFIIVLLFLIYIPDISRADSSGLGSAFSSANDFINRNKSNLYDSEMKNSHDVIFNTLFVIGVAITVIVGGILGIKFMIASAEDKAQIKELMIPYVIGCTVIYGAFGIWKFVVTVLNGI